MRKNFIVILLLIGSISTFAKYRTNELIQNLELLAKSEENEPFDSICSKYVIMQGLFDSTSINYAITGTYYANFLCNNGHDVEALNIINKCVPIFESSKKQHQQYIRLLVIGYRSSCSEKFGDYQLAKNFINLAKNLCEQYRISGSLYIEVLRFYSDYCDNIHLYDEEEKYIHQALEISEQIKDTLNSIRLYSDLAWMLYSINDYNQALKYGHKAQILYEQYDKCPLRIRLVADNTVICSLLELERYSDAISLLEKDIDNMDNSQDAYLVFLQNLGYTYFLQKDYHKALNQFERVYNELKLQNVRDESYQLLLCRRLLSMTYYLTGQIDKAFELSYEDFESRRRNILTNLLFLLERERAQYWDEESFMFEDFYPNIAILGSHSIKEFGNLFYDCLLLSKGLLLSSSNAFQKKIMQSSDLRILTLWNNYCKISVAIELEKDPNHEDLLKNELESVEELLMQYCLQNQNALLPITTSKDVALSLHEGEAAIEFAKIHDIQDVYDLHSEELFSNFPSKYYALILLPQDQYPIIVPLGTLSDSDHVNQDIWKSLLPYLDNVSTLYFSPSGALHQIPLEYLPYDSASTMSDHFNMVRLSSTRELVAKYESATIYGGILYDVDTEELAAESKNYDGMSLEVCRGLEDDTLNRGSVKYLPGTMKEVETINKMFTEHHVTAQLYVAKAANEESFKALSGRHQHIIHIATHGFTWSDSIAQEKEFFTQQDENSAQEERPTIDPMSRCGLLFAGANTALSGHSNKLPDRVQDGILTAQEISLMDLRDCDLVVLSACETAKGDITSEGVFGLQRAFKMAGVQTIIMSLWKVDDNATQMLMTEFYTNWIEKKQSKREAFKNAQNTVRYAVDKDGDRMYENPRYWAGFIMLD